jgi:16S rRNA (uracil1498-N3)-methyltransferase
MAIPNTRRFFVPPTSLAGDQVLLQDTELAHQLGKVLRLRPGDQVLLLDGQGTACTVTLTDLGKNHVAGRVEARTAAGGEPTTHITLYMALLRAERFEWVLQKATELGVSAIVPVHFSRSLPGDKAEARKLERWRRIVREAAEQSCRGRLPTVAEPLPFAAACAQASESALHLMLWEGDAQALKTVLHSWQKQTTTGAQCSMLNAQCSMLSGPEGGIAPEELTTAAAHGIIPVSLGPRILRAETAPIAALAALLYELE